MSAFVVETQTIDNILTALETMNRRQGWPERRLKELGFELGPEGFNALGQAMLQLNVDAYNHHYEGSQPVESYRHRYRSISPLQGYKSLQCWLYQCSEGDVPNQPLFTFFHDKVKPIMADGIIADIPQYDRCTWG